MLALSESSINFVLTRHLEMRAWVKERVRVRIERSQILVGEELCPGVFNPST